MLYHKYYIIIEKKTIFKIILYLNKFLNNKDKLFFI